MENPVRTDPFGSDVAVTQILVVSDIDRSRDFWVDVLGAELNRGTRNWFAAVRVS